MKKVRIDRLKALVKKYGSQAKLIEAGDDINKAYISQMINGVRPMGERAARNLEEKLGLKPFYFDQEVSNVAEGSAIYRASNTVPLISWVQAGSWHEATDPFAPGDADDWHVCPSKHSSTTYALRIKGDSMTSAYGRSYPEGMIIFVDPEKQAVNGDRVIAKVNGDNAVTFKQLVIDGDRKYLKPLNPAYPVITDPFSVLGKIIGAYMEE